MTMARRGIFGMLAALPFVPEAAAVDPAEAKRRMTCHVTITDLDKFEMDLLRTLASAGHGQAQETVVNAVFREYIEAGPALPSGADDAQGAARGLAAPFGWDTLENVR